MNTVAGYEMSSWDSGYGDFVLRPDLATLRLVPWHEGTALVLADVERVAGGPVPASPRQVLRRQLDRLAERGLGAYVGTELEFIVFDDSYEQAWDRPTTTCDRPTSTTWTTRCWAPAGSSRCCATSATA